MHQYSALNTSLSGIFLFYVKHLNVKTLQRPGTVIRNSEVNKYYFYMQNRRNCHYYKQWHSDNSEHILVPHNREENIKLPSTRFPIVSIVAVIETDKDCP